VPGALAALLGAVDSLRGEEDARATDAGGATAERRREVIEALDDLGDRTVASTRCAGSAGWERRRPRQRYRPNDLSL
jgi:hypothetical protein